MDDAKITDDANLDDAKIRDDTNLEVETRRFPENCNVAFPALTGNLMAKFQSGFASSHTSKSRDLGSIKCLDSLGRVKVQRQKFNEPLDVRRRLTRITMSYCTPLKEAMRNENAKSLMRTIRDAMIVYYEAYKRPESGFIQGGKHFMIVFVRQALTNNLLKKTSPLRTY